MRVRLLCGRVTDRGSFAANAVIEVPDDEGKRMIEKGLATKDLEGGTIDSDVIAELKAEIASLREMQTAQAAGAAETGSSAPVGRAAVSADAVVSGNPS